MATIKQYTKQDGTKLWMFQTYLGVNQATGKSVKTTRRGFNTKKEAQLELNRLLVDFEKNGSTKNRSMTFEKLYILWFEQHKKDIKPTTEQRIKIYFDNHILKRFSKMRITKITPLFCQKILNDWADNLATYKQMRIYVSMVFKYGILIGVINDNPMERTIIPKHKNITEKKNQIPITPKKNYKNFSLA